MSFRPHDAVLAAVRGGSPSAATSWRPEKHAAGPRPAERDSSSSAAAAAMTSSSSHDSGARAAAPAAAGTSSTGAAGVGLTRPAVEALLRKRGVDTTAPAVAEAVADLFARASEWSEAALVRDGSPGASLVSRGMRDELAIPRWSYFCRRLRHIFDDVRRDVRGGVVATYIPILAEQDPNWFSVSVTTVDGQSFSLGHTDVRFSMQSCIKPVLYSMAVAENGLQRIHRHVGYAPSGLAFNEVSLNSDGKPHNPLINAGAIATASLIRPDQDLATRFRSFFDFAQRTAGPEKIGFSQPTYLCEAETAFRNHALMYYMMQHGVFPRDASPEDALDFYLQGCSIEANTRAAANIAATFAAAGRSPLTGDTVFDAATAKAVLTLMFSSGMYDYSGEWCVKVGLPAKSGVAGLIYVVIPHVAGIAIFSPPLDSHGNSLRGIEFCKRLVREFPLGVFDQVVASRVPRGPRRESLDDEVVLVRAPTQETSGAPTEPTSTRETSDASAAGGGGRQDSLEASPPLAALAAPSASVAPFAARSRLESVDSTLTDGDCEATVIVPDTRSPLVLQRRRGAGHADVVASVDGALGPVPVSESAAGGKDAEDDDDARADSPFPSDLTEAPPEVSLARALSTGLVVDDDSSPVYTAFGHAVRVHNQRAPSSSSSLSSSLSSLVPFERSMVGRPTAAHGVAAGRSAATAATEVSIAVLHPLESRASIGDVVMHGMSHTMRHVELWQNLFATFRRIRRRFRLLTFSVTHPDVDPPTMSASPAERSTGTEGRIVTPTSSPSGALAPARTSSIHPRATKTVSFSNAAADSTALTLSAPPSSSPASSSSSFSLSSPGMAASSLSSSGAGSLAQMLPGAEEDREALRLPSGVLVRFLERQGFRVDPRANPYLFGLLLRVIQSARGARPALAATALRSPSGSPPASSTSSAALTAHASSPSSSSPSSSPTFTQGPAWTSEGGARDDDEREAEEGDGEEGEGDRRITKLPMDVPIRLSDLFVADRDWNPVLQALSGQLVISSFGSFAHDIRDISDATARDEAALSGDLYRGLDIEELWSADADGWGVSVCTVDGQTLHVGATAREFPLMSAVKPLLYALALRDLDESRVHEWVGTEPAYIDPEGFGMQKRDEAVGAVVAGGGRRPRLRPYNPFTDSGALAICSLFDVVRKFSDRGSRFTHIVQFLERLAGGRRVGFANPVFLAQKRKRLQLLALSHFMKGMGLYPPATEPVDNASLLFQASSIVMNCESLAAVAATLARAGLSPHTNERVLSSDVVRQVLSLMYSSGLNQYTGDWAFNIGIPAAGGVSGAMLVVVPNVMGIAFYAPRLNAFQVPPRVVRFCQMLSKRYRVNIFDSVVFRDRGVRSRDGARPSLEIDQRGDHRPRAADRAQSRLFFELCLAVHAGDADHVQELLEDGVDLNQSDYDKRTALHVAASDGRPDLARLLVRAGAPILARDRWGHTPRDEAAALGNHELVEFFDDSLRAQGFRVAAPAAGAGAGAGARALVTVTRGDAPQSPTPTPLPISHLLASPRPRFDPSERGPIDAMVLARGETGAGSASPRLRPTPSPSGSPLARPRPSPDHVTMGPRRK